MPLTTPTRVQLSRQRGWRMPPNTIKVSRPGMFGNPYRVERDSTGWWCMLDREKGFLFRTPRGARMQAAACYREWLDASHLLQQAATAELRGKNLACWCSLPKPGEPDHCHAAILLEYVNRPIRGAGNG